MNFRDVATVHSVVCVFLPAAVNRAIYRNGHF